MRTHRVTYEFDFKDSGAARERLMKAILECQANFDGLKCSDVAGLHNALVKLTPEKAKQFSETAKVRLLYRSPTYFDNGTIFPIYHFPEEEVEARAASERMVVSNGQQSVP